MTEKELRFICAYDDCEKETTVIVTVSKSLPMGKKSVSVVRFCEHCNRANKLELPDNLDVHEFTLGDEGFLDYTGDDIPCLQGEKDI
jgi:hypothetical protein